ncbi:GIY-YIG nuclease family protein [Gluconacetobacter tumulicola]|uniref:GIY-YIG nuclease family protein n=1 Tax=Gluconacetobacter tumulicola TaxID=1017177 RepID=A0A7W4P5S1_9PROT|nr:GIY-YIG nuclease family protein [Gluconacetobacter tumulicola]MBB2178169.1 GIY-YIG nuclease family protein [Gluconacetobacter tumulicola]
MKGKERKAAIAAYKERKVEAGIYAVRCSVTGQVWVGSAPDLSTIQNRLWFTLRHGSNTHRTLQQAWTIHGSDAFTFDIVERLEDDDPGYVRNVALKKRQERWQDQLQAMRI